MKKVEEAWRGHCVQQKRASLSPVIQDVAEESQAVSATSTADSSKTSTSTINTYERDYFEFLEKHFKGLYRSFAEFDVAKITYHKLEVAGVFEEFSIWLNKCIA